MSVYKLKPWFVGRLSVVTQRLADRGTHPNTVTVAGVVAAALAGVALVAGAWLDPLWWAAVPLLGVLRLAANAIDGSLARLTGRSSARGEVLNEVGDRAGDGVMLAALGPSVGWGLAGWAVAAAFLVAFVGVLAQAATGERDSSGPMGKADRVMVLSIAAPVAIVDDRALPLAAVLVIAGAAVTVTRRVAALWRRAKPAQAELLE